jgi:hypothetical protein
MPVEYQRDINHHGNTGRLIITARLRPLSEANWDIPEAILSQSPGRKTFGDFVREGVRGTTLVDLLTFTEHFIPYTDVIAADGDGADLDAVFLDVTFTFDIDPGARPLYPSDLEHDMRRAGIAEHKIQALLEWERAGRAGKQGESTGEP